MYQLYKPLRNFLRPYNAWSGFGATYSYMQFLQFQQALPKTLLTFDLQRGTSKWKAGLHEWLVELLARELLLNADLGRSSKPFNTAQLAFRAMRAIHDIEGEAWRLHPSRSSDILLQLSRIAFKQFHWQVPLTNSLLTRYYRLYAHPPVAQILEREFGVSVEELFQLVMLLAEEMRHGPVPAFAFLEEADQSIVEPVRALSNRITAAVGDLRAQAVALQKYDIDWAYTFNPLRSFPLVHAGMQVSAMCPAPPLLLRRLTDGLYFDLMRADPKAGAAIGEAFESYVGEVTRLLAGEALTITGEIKYGRPEKKSVDWIVADDSATLFLECKLARLDIASQTQISASPPFTTAIAKLAEAIGQVYATLADALAGNYPHWTADNRPIWTGIVTFYEWFAFGPFFYQTLESLVTDVFAKRGLDPALLDRYPYFLCSIDEFEGLVAAFAASGIDSVLRKKNMVEHRRSITRGFLADQFPGCINTAAGAQELGVNQFIYAGSRLVRRD